MAQDLQDIRKAKKMSVNQLATKSGISIAKLVQYEKGAEEIPTSDLGRLAKALYVDEWDINRRSASPPPPPPEKKQARPKPSQPKGKRPEKKPQPQSPPARESQITHLLSLAARFGVDRAALETEVGKPLEELTQKEARHWNHQYTQRIVEEKPPKSPIDRKRAYLPEGVDGFELTYLEEQQQAGASLQFTLFDGQTFAGTVAGFGPYQIIIREADGGETTLNKLAIAYYHKSGEAE